MSEQAKEKPKIIVDEDWKSQAQAEKEELEKKQREKKKDQSTDNDPGTPPPASFQTLVSTIVTQAMMSLGRLPDPVDGKYVARLGLAKFYIDSLGVLEEKTKGNLSDEESAMMTDLLHQLRMDYVSGGYKPPPAPVGGNDTKKKE